MRPLFISIILIILSLVGGYSQTNPDSLIERQIRPSDTDPLIWLWNTDSNYVYINHTASAINKLFVFLPGSYGVPKNDKAINQKAANMGYHSIGLRYPNSWSMIGQCGNSADINCHYNLRTEVLYGMDTYSGINVDTINSIKNRLVKLLLYLDTNYPTENWGQYLDINNEPAWNLIAMGGHSQGGGYGSVAALDNQLFRILNFASNDYSFYYNQPANWYFFPKVTTSDKYYGIVHLQDGPTEYLEMMDALGVDTMLTTNVDTNSNPYNNAHILFTNVIPPSGTAWVDYHNSLAVDNSIPIDTAGNYVFEEVWEYMLSIDTTILGIYYSEYSKDQNLDVKVYPNPVNTNTSIYFQLLKDDRVSIEIINIQGKHVKTLVANQDYIAGRHSVQWNGINNEMKICSTGIYFVEITAANGLRRTTKLILLR